MDATFELLGDAGAGPTLRLDHRRFAYAGKFGMADTGKAVARSPSGDVLAAVSFSPARVEDDVLWIRYVTVRDDRRGEGLGPRLCRFAVARAADGRRVRIAVNNPFAYDALYKAGFGYTGEVVGMGELVLATDAPRGRDRYQAGLDVFRDRELGDPERAFLARREGAAPPEVVEVPDGARGS